MAGAFLSLRRVLPDRYPLEGEIATYIRAENQLGRMLDYGVIAPRLQALYDWSAGELAIPGLRDLVRDGNPTYAWPHADRHIWRQARDSGPVRAIRVATSGHEPK